MKSRLILFSFFLLSCASKPSIYIKSDLAIPKGEKIAILPFTNLAGSPGAGEKLSNLLMVEVLKTKKLSVVDPGQVEALLSRERIRLLDKLPPENVKRIGSALQVKYIVVGTVLEYRTLREGKYDTPFIALSVRMINTDNGEIVLAVSRAVSGRDWEKVFGIGRITSLEKLSKIVSQEIAKSLTKGARS